MSKIFSTFRFRAAIMAFIFTGVFLRITIALVVLGAFLHPSIFSLNSIGGRIFCGVFVFLIFSEMTIASVGTSGQWMSRLYPNFLGIVSNSVWLASATAIFYGLFWMNSLGEEGTFWVFLSTALFLIVFCLPTLMFHGMLCTSKYKKLIIETFYRLEPIR